MSDTTREAMSMPAAIRNGLYLAVRAPYGCVHLGPSNTVEHRVRTIAESADWLATLFDGTEGTTTIRFSERFMSEDEVEALPEL